MTGRALPRFLDQILLAAAPGLTPTACEEIAGIRVSTASLKKLANHVAEGDRVWENHAVIGPWLRSLPEGLFTDMDDDARRRHGIHRIQLGDIHDGMDRTKRVGYAGIARAQDRFALVLLVHHGASDADVETIFGPRNSWAELMVGAWEWATQCLLARFSNDDRMNRSAPVYVRISEAVKARPGGRYYLGDLEIDPHSQGWEGMIRGQKSSDEVQTGKIRRLAGRLTKLENGAWPRGNTPIGTRLGCKEDVRGELKPSKAAGLEADTDRAEEFTQVLSAYAAGTSKSYIAVAQARRGARDGDGALLLPRLAPLLDDAARDEVRGSLDELHEKGTITEKEADRCREALSKPTNPVRREKATNAGAEYVDRILRGRRQLRTGVLPVLTLGAIAGRTEYLGWRPTFVTTATGVTQSTVQTVSEKALEAEHPYWELSDERRRKAQTHGFWVKDVTIKALVTLSDAQWAAIEKRVRDAAERMERRAASGRRRPLGGLRWQDERGQYHFGQGGERELYRITGPDGRHLHSVGATQAARSLGELLWRLVERVDAGPLPLLPSAQDSPETRRSRLQQDIHDLKATLYSTEKQMSGLQRDRSSEQEGTRKYRLLSQQLDELDAVADDIEHRQLPALLARLANDDNSGTSGVLEEVAADFAQVAVIAEALTRCDPLGSAALHDAVSWLLDHGRGLSNLREGEHARQILIDVRVRVPQPDGSIEVVDAGTLDLTDRRSTASRKQEFADDLARRLLRDGEPVASLCARFDWELTQVLEAAASWLTQHTTLNMYLRAAVVTAAAAGGDLLVGPVVYAAAVGDTDTLELLRRQADAWVVPEIERAYLRADSSWAKNAGWLRGPLSACRIAMLSIAQDGATRRGPLVASVDGLRNDEHLHDLLRPGRRSFWQPPLLLDDGWVRAHKCSAPDCPGGGNAAMTGFLPVPELLPSGDAVFCSFCWRTLGTGRVLPAPYRQHWDVSSIATALQRADGIPTVTAPPAAPVRATTPLRSRDVAQELGLPVYQVSRLAKDGHLPASKSVTGKLVFTPGAALSPTMRQRYGQAPNDSAVSPVPMDLPRAAEHLGTSRTMVRMLSNRGVLKNVGKEEGRARYEAAALDALLASVRAQTGRGDATLADLASLSELASQWRVTVTKVRNLVAAGVLKQVLLGPLTWVDRTSIAALDDRTRRALDPDIRMTTKQVGELAEIHASTVLHHHASGNLPGVQFGTDGTVWFLPDEVQAWIASRRRP